MKYSLKVKRGNNMKSSLKKDKNIIIVSGGFDPIHEGHIALFNSASMCLGQFEKIYVLVNSDEWLMRKKGKSFQSFYTRKTIVENLHMVQEALAFDDSDNTAIMGIEKIVQDPKNSGAVFYFCNGGDRQKGTTPEDEYCAKNGVKSLYGIGGEDKKNSSSDILEGWKK